MRQMFFASAQEDFQDFGSDATTKSDSGAGLKSIVSQSVCFSMFCVVSMFYHVFLQS